MNKSDYQILSPYSGDFIYDFEKNTLNNIDLNTIKVIYWRKPSSDCYVKPLTSLTKLKGDIKLTEFEKVMDFICHKNTHIKWLNKFTDFHKNDNKLIQLDLARSLDIKIPATIISNIRPSMEFVGIYKPIYAKLRVDDNDCLFSVKTTQHCEQVLDSIPYIHQSYIPKAFELRITIVGNKFFSCKIDSQQSKDERTRIDWRHYNLDKIYWTIYQLPSEIESKLLSLMKKMNLNFGCIDMIVTPDEEYVFLEINANGQWLWIEGYTGMKISREIANVITEYNNLPNTLTV